MVDGVVFRYAALRRAMFSPTMPTCRATRSDNVDPSDVKAFTSSFRRWPWGTRKLKYSSVFRENRCLPPPKVYGGNFSHEAVTLKIRSRSPKSNKLLILSDLYRLANLVTFHPMVHEMQTNTFWLKFGGLSLAVTLKIRSRSPKAIQLFIMSKCYIPANLVKIRQLVHEILGTQAPF